MCINMNTDSEEKTVKLSHNSKTNAIKVKSFSEVNGNKVVELFGSEEVELDKKEER
jgi:hypothetical protein